MRSLLGHETTQGCTLELTGNAAWAPVAAHHAVAAVDLASVEDVLSCRREVGWDLMRFKGSSNYADSATVRQKAGKFRKNFTQRNRKGEGKSDEQRQTCRYCQTGLPFVTHLLEKDPAYNITEQNTFHIMVASMAEYLALQFSI